MTFIARSLPKERDDDGRDALPSPVQADPFLSALVSLVELDRMASELQKSIKREQCKMRRADGLDISLVVIRNRLEDMRRDARELQDKICAMRADEIDDATQVYGV